MSATRPLASSSEEYGHTKNVILDHETAAPRAADEDSHEDADLEVNLNADSAESCIADVALAMSMQSSFISMRLSLMESVEAHGRTYHKYKQGAYYMPNDKVEQDRLDMQHQLFYLSLNSKLYLAPVASPRRALDIGTGTGIWAVDFALANPAATVLGTDLSAIQPAFVPPNCSFQVSDAEDDWNHEDPFDLIHGRALFTCFRDPKAIFQRAYNALAPGGYFEMQDVWMRPQSHDETLAGTNLEKWYEMIMAATSLIGRDWECAQRYAEWMREIRFEDVRERKLRWPQNTWPKGERNKVLGLWTMENTLNAVVSVSTALLIRVLGMSEGEVGRVMEGVRGDMRDRGIHCFYWVYIVYGRKPL